tara:strand:+ start:313 stop:1659 length:1347 start_codon:yes stop_codon:yes gene_type:complete
MSAISATSAPHSNEAEQMVLGKLINYPELFEEVYSIVPEPNMFYIDAHRILWDIMIMMYGIKEDINYVTIVNNIPKKYEKDLDAYYITGLIDAVPGKTGVESYAKIVYDKWLLRNAIEDAYKITKAGQLSDADGYKMIENINASTSKIMSMRHNEKFDMNELLEETMSKIYDVDATVKFGYGQLDAMTGGMTRGEISVIAGRPGHGKTTLAVNIVRRLIHQGYKVLVFNREMPNKEMMKKIMIMEAEGLSYYNLRLFKYGDRELKELQKTKEKVSKLYSNNLFMFDAIRDLNSSIAQAKKIKPDVIVDDYLQIIDVPNIQEKRLQISEIMKSYKWLAKEENLSVLVVSQLNRALEQRINKRPQLSDLAESGSIEQDAETIIFNYYPWKYLGKENHDLGELGKYQLHTIVGKSRYAETGFLEMGFHGDSCCVLDTRDMAENKARKYGEI